MSESRIPPLQGITEEDARAWFLAMREADLLFDPYDDATWIVHRETDEPFFTPQEAQEANDILERLIDALGDRFEDVAYPILMEAIGMNPHPEEEDDSWKS